MLVDDQDRPGDAENAATAAPMQSAWIGRPGTFLSDGKRHRIAVLAITRLMADIVGHSRAGLPRAHLRPPGRLRGAKSVRVRHPGGS